MRDRIDRAASDWAGGKENAMMTSTLPWCSMKRLATCAALTGALAACLAACGGSEPEPVAPEPVAAEPAPTPASAANEPTPTSEPASKPAPAHDASVENMQTGKTDAPTSSAPAADPSGLDVDGANVTMGSVSADGFTMKNVACKADGGGGLGALMLGPTIAATIGSKKAQLRGCSAKGGEARVRFTMANGKTNPVEATAASPEIEKCVVKVMKTVPGAMPATCAATLDLGK